MQGGSSGGVALTAYVTISLLENIGNTHVCEFLCSFYVKYSVIVGQQLCLTVIYVVIS